MKKNTPGRGGEKNSRKCNRQIYRRFMEERCSDFEMMSGVYDIDEVVFVTKQSS